MCTTRLGYYRGSSLHRDLELDMLSLRFEDTTSLKVTEGKHDEFGEVFPIVLYNNRLNTLHLPHFTS
jgi:hypothetical protein